MDELRRKLTELTRKYRCFALILLLGILLMLLPTGKAKRIEVSASELPEASVEQRLQEILSCIAGVGRADVMLNIARGEETFYQNDLSTSEASSRSDTVVLTDSSRNQSGLVRQINPPVYSGAVVVCQGGDRAEVKLAVMEAVSKITGLKFSQITVLKMK